MGRLYPLSPIGSAQPWDPSFHEPFSNVTCWFCSCVHQPQFSAVLGEVKMYEKAAQCQGAIDARNYGNLKKIIIVTFMIQSSGKLSRRQRRRQMAAENEAEDPFAALPHSPFVLDEFKRQYSNEDPIGGSPGMFQRLRKNGFASVAVFGKDANSSISGVWLFRGQQPAFKLCDDWKMDYSLYSWRKLYPDSEEYNTLVKEYLRWEGEFKHVGKPFNQGKIFKQTPTASLGIWKRVIVGDQFL
ncbi:EF1G factor, partial [Polyodon spathula]|nr:EF1G factor [Polyodon spathula]